MSIHYSDPTKTVYVWSGPWKGKQVTIATDDQMAKDCEHEIVPMTNYGTPTGFVNCWKCFAIGDDPEYRNGADATFVAGPSPWDSPS